MLAEGPVLLPASEVTVRAAASSEIDLVASFWSEAKERPELSAAIDVAVHHPNPHETLVPLLACLDGEPVSAALVYRYGRTAGIHLVATRPGSRGRGAASELVRHARARHPAGAADRYGMYADSPRLEARLATLGFVPARTYTEYELPREAELTLPAPAPPGPPRWRPPR